MGYHDFLETKRLTVQGNGISVTDAEINQTLFPFQRDLVRWALRKGRSAIFADTGLGKTFMQVEWARLLGGRSLIVAPLSVARQTVREAAKIGVHVHYTRGGDDLSSEINITNYEMIEAFDFSAFESVVLDESSILKGLSGKTRQKLTSLCAGIRRKLCCTATPAPNDIAEIANHAEFLGVMTRAEMLAAFFVHDDDGWRLKGHAAEAFYRWLSSWGMSIRKPSDLGYSDDGYILPALTIEPVYVRVDYQPEGQLFFTGLKGIRDRSHIRKATTMARVNKASAIVNGNDEQWIVWCGLNAESNAITSLIPDAVEVKGADSLESKIAAIEAFQDGQARVLVTKPRIAGFGMNFQNCHNQAFVGLSDSWEAYYQCIRRSWRFGQESPVNVWIVLSDLEQAIYHNVMDKERSAAKMAANLIDHVQNYERAELDAEYLNGWEYKTGKASGKSWDLLLGDSVERMAEIESESVGLSVFSPPFLSLFTYSPSERDLGNSRDKEQFFQHFSLIINELLRITKPGRLCCCHTADIPAILQNDGYIGIKDFSGDCIRAFVDGGWIFHGRVTIDKNPQAQAIRTHAKALLFNQKNKDSSWSRPAIADYILIFRKPGENAVPVDTDVDNETWIRWAHPIWYDIDETKTLNYRQARNNDDERHICPLQLDTIERCVRLWSNPGELVFSPFAGVGSEVYQAVMLGRRGLGIELKPEYFEQAVRNLQEADRNRATMTLFDFAEMEDAADD